MATRIRELMTPDPISLPATSSAMDAARAMRDADIGNVVVVDGQKVFGIVTDRDIVLRVVAEGRDSKSTLLRDVCSQHDLATLSPQDSVDKAVQVMREKAVRRLPVVENQRPVGIISIGDLALEKDPQSALDHISGAPPNR
jgi:CBS domain-containing protein